MNKSYTENDRISDKIRKNLSVDEIHLLLEDAGLDEDEDGDELVFILAEAIIQGDICESVAD